METNTIENQNNFLPLPDDKGKDSREKILDEILSPDEELLFKTRPIWWLWAVSSIIWIVIGILIAYASRYILCILPDNWPSEIQDGVYWFGIAVIILAALLAISRLFRRFFTIYALTSHRVLIHRGLFSKYYAESPIDRIKMIELEIPVIGRILNFGTVGFYLEKENAIMHWENIRNPRQAKQILDNTLMTKNSIPEL